MGEICGGQEGGLDPRNTFSDPKWPYSVSREALRLLGMICGRQEGGMMWRIGWGVQCPASELVPASERGSEARIRGGVWRPARSLLQNGPKCTVHCYMGSNFEFLAILDLPLGVKGPLLQYLGD